MSSIVDLLEMITPLLELIAEIGSGSADAGSSAPTTP